MHMLKQPCSLNSSFYHNLPTLSHSSCIFELQWDLQASFYISLSKDGLTPKPKSAARCGQELQSKRPVRTSMKPCTEKNFSQHDFCVNGSIETRTSHSPWGSHSQNAAHFSFGVNHHFLTLITWNLKLASYVMHKSLLDKWNILCTTRQSWHFDM